MIQNYELSLEHMFRKQTLTIPEEEIIYKISLMLLGVQSEIFMLDETNCIFFKTRDSISLP